MLRAEIKHQAAYALFTALKNGFDRTVLEDGPPGIVVTRSNNQTFNSQINEVTGSLHVELISAFGNDPPTLLKLIEGQRIDTYCKQVFQCVGIPKRHRHR